MIIAQISDTHITVNTPDSDRRILDFEIVIRDINDLIPQPNLIIHSGDIVQNGLFEEYVKAKEIISGAIAPVYVMVGNKDSRNLIREAFSGAGYLSSNSQFIDYEVDNFPVKLIFVDTLHRNSKKGGFCDYRKKNLIRMIDSGSAKPVAVFMHHPPCEINVGPELFHFEKSEIMSELCETLQLSGRVISVFCGHVHRSTTGRIATIPVTVVPSVATLLRWGEYPTHMKQLPTYNVHRYDKDWGFITETRIAGLFS